MGNSSSATETKRAEGNEDIEEPKNLSETQLRCYRLRQKFGAVTTLQVGSKKQFHKNLIDKDGTMYLYRVQQIEIMRDGKITASIPIAYKGGVKPDQVLDMVKFEDDVYLSDWGSHRIFHVDLKTGVGEVFAGTGVRGYLDGPSNKAKFWEPWGLCIDEEMNCIYVSDMKNNMIRRIDFGDQIVSTVSGTVLSRRSGNTVRDECLNYPRGMFISKMNPREMFITDNSALLSLNLNTFKLTLLAGGDYHGFADGFDEHAKFSFPKHIDQNSLGCVFISDRSNHRLRIYLGSEVFTASGDGVDRLTDGRKNECSYRNILSLALTKCEKYLYIIDRGYTIRRIDVELSNGDIIEALEDSVLCEHIPYELMDLITMFTGPFLDFKKFLEHGSVD